MSYRNWSITVDATRHEFGPVEVESWSINGREYRVDDTDRPRADGIYFGKDFATPGDVEISLIIRASGTTREERFNNAMLIRDGFTAVWNGDSIRSTPGAVAELEIAGHSVVEGRPRHVDWDDSRATFGIIRGTALFVRSSLDSYVLDADGHAPWLSATLQLVPSQVGGLKAPLKAPLRTSVESTRAAPLEVGGDTEAWPVMELTGPIQSDAQLLIQGRWRLYLNRALGPYQTALIDTRPGRRGTYLNGAPVQLLDPRSSMLGDCSLLPGTNVLSLRGSSIEGTAQVDVRWRDTRGAF